MFLKRLLKGVFKKEKFYIILVDRRMPYLYHDRADLSLEEVRKILPNIHGAKGRITFVEVFSLKSIKKRPMILVGS